MTQINQNLIDLSPDAIRMHIAAGRTERSMVMHRALAAAAAWLRRGPPRRPRPVSAARLGALNA
jgi:hypothetical protein